MGHRVTQVPAVVIVQPDDAEARVTQVGAVALVDTKPPARISMLAFEAIRENTPNAVASQSRAFVVG